MILKTRAVAFLAIILAGCGHQHAKRATASGDPAPSPAQVDGSASAGPPAAASAEASGEQLTIPAGTRIRIRLNETLDAKYCHAGESFSAQLDEPLVVGKRVVAPTGSPVRGHVTGARQSGRMRGRAVLGLTLDTIQVDGSSYTIATYSATRVSNSHNKRNAVAIAGGSATGAAIGAAKGGGPGALIGGAVGAGAGTVGAFFTGRKDIVLPVETELDFSLRTPVTIRG